MAKADPNQTSTVHHPPSWLSSERFLARTVARPIQRFLHIEASGGILLLVAAVAAIVWANSPWSASYETFWSTEITIGVGDHALTEDLRHWVNDGLMTFFFFVIGLEIKQELVSGQLSSARRAMVPAAAALGGMVVPALLYVAFNAGGDGSSGWGIPMATDVAFAVGVLSMLGRRVPAELKVLLLGLAIVDDIGAVLVIAAFYTEELDVRWGAAALAGIALAFVARQAHIRFLPVYAVLGAGVWLATLESGIHATIAGVVLGLLAPARPFLREIDADRIADELSADRHVTAAEVREMSFRIRESVPVTERLQDLLHPWTGYVIVPLFALANAGVVVSGDTLGDAVGSPVAIGVVVGLVAGKFIGVSGAVALVRRLGLGELPATVGTRHVLGLAGLAGIGFTVSIFVTELAFDDLSLLAEAKLGVLAASILASVVGAAILLPSPSTVGARGSSGHPPD